MGVMRMLTVSVIPDKWKDDVTEIQVKVVKDDVEYKESQYITNDHFESFFDQVWCRIKCIIDDALKEEKS